MRWNLAEQHRYYLEMNESAANEDSLVGLDVPCEACGYNLRGSSRDGVCPECARAVPLSLARYYDVAGGFAAGRRDAVACYVYASAALALPGVFVLQLAGIGTRGRHAELLLWAVLVWFLLATVLASAVAAGWRDRYPRRSDWPMIWPVALVFVLLQFQEIDWRSGGFPLLLHILSVVLPCWIVGEAYYASVRLRCRSARDWSIVAIVGLQLTCACETNAMLVHLHWLNSRYFGTDPYWPVPTPEPEYVVPFAPLLTVPAVFALANHLRRNGHLPADRSRPRFLQIIGLQSYESARDTPARRPG